MPRTTRAAARADPALADETMAVAEIAIAEDTTVVNTEQSANETLSQDQDEALSATEAQRAPLGEITAGSERVNNLTSDEESATNALVESVSDSSSSQSENVVLLLGAKSKYSKSSKAKKSVKSPSKKDPKKPSKNSIRLQVKEPRGQALLQQLRNSTATESALENGVAPRGESAFRPEDVAHMAIKEDDTIASVSTAPLDATALLKEPTKKPVTSENAVKEMGPTRTPSPASSEASKMLEKREPQTTALAKSANNNLKNGKSTKVNAVQKSKPKAFEPKRKQVQPANASRSAVKLSAKVNNEIHPATEATVLKESQSQAVQKLASLFEPQLDETSEHGAAVSPLNNILATQPMSPPSGSKDPIEAMDDLEESIEAIEKSIADCNTKASPSKRGPPNSANTNKSQKKAKTAVQERKVSKPLAASKPSNEPASKEQSTISKPQKVEALNTPPAVQKSTKPLTVSKFNLSSEATAARLKTQREERQRRREEEEQERKQTKFKTVKPIVKPIEVRTTTASRARMSLLADKPKETQVTSTSTDKRRSTTIGPSTAARVQGLSSATSRQSQSISPLKRQPSDRPVQPAVGRKTISPVLAKASTRPISFTPTTKAGPSASMGRKSLPNPASKPKRPSTIHATTKRTSNKPQSSVSETVSTGTGKLANQSNSIANTSKTDKKERELTTKEKAEAAKKARLEAAERGRAASKEWAEKKKRATASVKLGGVPESMSGKQVTTIREEDNESGENKENEKEIPGNLDQIIDMAETPTQEPSKDVHGLAKSVLVGNTHSQEDAAYIVAEMKRIDKIVAGTCQS